MAQIPEPDPEMALGNHTINHGVIQPQSAGRKRRVPGGNSLGSIMHEAS